MKRWNEKSHFTHSLPGSYV